MARVVHSKASCTVHWQESGRPRPGVRDLPAAQILGIQPVRGAGKPGKGVSMGGDVKRADGQVSESSDNCSYPSGLESTLNPAQSSTLLVTLTSINSPPCLGQDGSGNETAETSGPTSSQTCTSGEIKEAGSHGEPIQVDQSQELPGASADGCSPPTDMTGCLDDPIATGRSPQQIREEGWCVQGSENVTLAELYLMMGKPGKLQLEYEWQPKSRPLASSNSCGVLRCLLRLVTSEVNPKPVSRCCRVFGNRI